MPAKSKDVYQFKITLQHVEPVIWRRIQVPENYTFWDLHVAIQDAMGWQDYHLHQFDIKNPMTGKIEFISIPEDEGELLAGQPIYAGWDKLISDYFSMNNSKAKYCYDFGDNWEHDVLLEKIVSKEAAKKYPVCLDGERSCPPEDCGGPWRYDEFLNILKNKNHPIHREKKDWVGRKFNPEQFDIKKIKFDNPKKRWKAAFEEPIEF